MRRNGSGAHEVAQPDGQLRLQGALVARPRWPQQRGDLLSRWATVLTCTRSALAGCRGLVPAAE